MASNKRLLILPGDGIGPEVMAEVRRLMDWFDRRRAVSFDVTEGLVGGASYDKHGTPVTDETMEQAMEADAVLFGAVGGPQWDNLDFSVKPERGLLRLRKDMDLFANLRPAVVFDGLVDASSLKAELVQGLDIMILRPSSRISTRSAPSTCSNMARTISTHFYRAWRRSTKTPGAR